MILKKFLERRKLKKELEAVSSGNNIDDIIEYCDIQAKLHISDYYKRMWTSIGNIASEQKKYWEERDNE